MPFSDESVVRVLKRMESNSHPDFDDISTLASLVLDLHGRIVALESEVKALKGRSRRGTGR